MRRLAVALLCLAAVGFAACGGGGGDEEDIRAVVEASWTSTDPAACRRYGTLNLVEQSTKLQGEAAIRACEETKLEPHDLPSAVEVTRIEIDGGEATAQVDALDGEYSEQELLIRLVEEDGNWKEDEVLELAVFDREAFILEFGRGIMGDANSTADAEVAACFVGQMDRLSDAELEALILDPSPQPIIDLALACEPRSASA